MVLPALGPLGRRAIHAAPISNRFELLMRATYLLRSQFEARHTR